MLTGLPRDRRATVAVETALLVPIYLIVVFGMVDVGRFFIWVDQARRCAIVAANASSQLTTVSSGDVTVNGTKIPGLTTILTEVAAAAPAGNWSSANGLIVTALTTDKNGAPLQEVQAKYPANLAQASAYSCGSSRPPIVLTDPNDTLVITEVHYGFVPFTFLYTFLGKSSSIAVQDYSFYRVRQPTTLASPTKC